MKDKLFDILKKEKKPVSYEKIKEKYGPLNKDEENKLKSILNQELEEFNIIKTSNDNYVLIEKTSFRKGKFYGTRRGDGKVIITDYYRNKEGKAFYKTSSLDVDIDKVNGAIDGDYVLINLYKDNKNSPLKASVNRIIDRNLENIVGEVYSQGGYYFVKPIDKKKQNLIISLKNSSIDGLRVAVSLDKKLSDTKYTANIIRTFNHAYDPGEDILWEAFKCGIDYEFSHGTLDEIKQVPSVVRDIDRIGRSDLTDWEIFTIDGADTKDIDDALSCKILENGNYLVGVHIADVSHYVAMDSSIDKDALKRGTSVYLAGKVIPMLPRELSNGICSLNPEVERLAMSCIMEVTPNGKVVNHSIIKSIIKSNKKMTYDEVNKILKNYDSVDNSYKKFNSSLHNLNKLAIVLRNNRIKHGAIEFDRSELKLEYNEFDKVDKVKIRDMDLGENLIEEFMVLANEVVDKHLTSKNLPCLHRIHDVPSKDRLEEFFNLLNVLGYDFVNVKNYNNMTDPFELQKLANKIKETGKLSNILSNHMVRCMSRAKYSPDNIGHFGLAKDNYCHFTSPIRRYPDLVVHRILKAELENDEKSLSKISKNISSIGTHCSKKQQNASEAEKETLKMRCCEYMSEHIGEEFNGLVIDVSDRGLNVQLDNYIEGFVKTSDMCGNYYHSQEDYSLVSLDGLDDYNIGDYLKLQLIDTNKKSKSINFKILNKIKSKEKAKVIKFKK